MIGRGAPPEYLWLPRSAELRRIAKSDRGGGFQGEDRDISKADLSLIAETILGDLAAYHITITP